MIESVKIQDSNVYVAYQQNTTRAVCIFPLSAVAQRMEAKSLTFDGALDLLVETTGAQLQTQHKEQIKEACDAQVQQTDRSHSGGVGRSRAGVGGGEQRRNNLLAGVADHPRPVPAGRRRRVLARKRFVDEAAGGAGRQEPEPGLAERRAPGRV